jgi:RimJ/RimL family protein N-acetyltransferase
MVFGRCACAKLGNSSANAASCTRKSGANLTKKLVISFQPRFWGCGYATEAARAVKAAAWPIFGFPYVVSFIGPDNEPSIKVARRIGMELEEILPPEANKWKRTVHVYSQRLVCVETTP